MTLEQKSKLQFAPFFHKSVLLNGFAIFDLIWPNVLKIELVRNKQTTCHAKSWMIKVRHLSIKEYHVQKWQRKFCRRRSRLAQRNCHGDQFFKSSLYRNFRKKTDYVLLCKNLFSNVTFQNVDTSNCYYNDDDRLRLFWCHCHCWIPVWTNF